MAKKAIAGLLVGGIAVVGVVGVAMAAGKDEEKWQPKTLLERYQYAAMYGDQMTEDEWLDLLADLESAGPDWQMEKEQAFGAYLHYFPPEASVAGCCGGRC